MILLCPKVEESAPKIVADRLSALRESVGITRHESRQNIRVGASLRSWQAYAGLCAMATSQSRCRGAPGPGCRSGETLARRGQRVGAVDRLNRLLLRG